MDVGYYLLGIKQTSNKKDNERIARHAGNSKCHWNWLNNNSVHKEKKKQRRKRSNQGENGEKQKLSDIPQVEEIVDTSRDRETKGWAVMKGTTIAHNFHLLFGYTFGHIMSDMPPPPESFFLPPQIIVQCSSFPEGKNKKSLKRKMSRGNRTFAQLHASDTHILSHPEKK